MAQSVERRIGSAEVTGSIPVTSFLFLLKNSENSVKKSQKKPKNYCNHQYIVLYYPCITRLKFRKGVV